MPLIVPQAREVADESGMPRAMLAAVFMISAALVVVFGPLTMRRYRRKT